MFSGKTAESNSRNPSLDVLLRFELTLLFRGYARAYIKDAEVIRPSAIIGLCCVVYLYGHNLVAVVVLFACSCDKRGTA